MEKTLSNFLTSLGVPVSERYIQKLISSHPHYPSLLSVSDTLERLGIAYTARRLDAENLSDLSFPYLLPFDKGRGSMLLVKNKHDLKKYQKDLDSWDGVVLQAEPVNEVKDRLNNKLHDAEVRIKRFTICLLVTVFAGLLLPLLGSFPTTEWFLFLTAAIGAIAGFFLLTKDLGISYAAIDGFCNSGKKTNCDQVLKADIKLLGIHLPEMVVIYFSFQLLVTSMGAAFSLLVFANLIFAALSILTVPVIVFSLYYQYSVAKAWCRLCLVVVAILVIQLIFFSAKYSAGVVWPTAAPLSFISLIVLVAGGIMFLVLLSRALIERTNTLANVGTEANRVKHSIPVFKYFLNQQKQVDVQPLKNEMLMGNPNAPVRIIMVSNLFCNPCKQKHDVVNQLLAMYPDKVCVALRFIKPREDNESVGYLLGYWQQAILGQRNESQLTASLIHDWFTIWNLKKFRKKYPLTTGGDGVKDLENSHYAWIDRAGVPFTPMFFVNGFQLPKEYTIDDMMALIPELAEN